MIEEDSCVNIIIKLPVERMNLKVEPHPKSYNITWVDKTCSICHPILSSAYPASSYQDHIWCDILAMDITRILLGKL